MYRREVCRKKSEVLAVVEILYVEMGARIDWEWCSPLI